MHKIDLVTCRMKAVVCDGLILTRKRKTETEELKLGNGRQH